MERTLQVGQAGPERGFPGTEPIRTPEEVAAMLELHRKGWGAKRIARVNWAWPETRCADTWLPGIEPDGRSAKSAGFRTNPRQHAASGAIRRKKAPTESRGWGFLIGGGPVTRAKPS